MKKDKLNVGFITTYSGRWPKEIPEQRNQEYQSWLTEKLPEARIITASELGSHPEAIERIAGEFRQQEVDIIVLVYGAFTGDDAASCLAERLRVPIILWAPYEVPFAKEDRLYSNALCSMTMNAASLRRLEAVCHTVYGSYTDSRAAARVKNLIQAYSIIKAMKHTSLGLLGYRPTAFYNCTFDEGLIRRTFGIKMEETDLKVVFDRMEQLEGQDVEADMDSIKARYDVTQLPAGHLENHSRLYLALKLILAEQKYDFAVIKCWPEMGNLHTTPCAVLGRLADEGLNIGCEGDVDAELAQIAEYYLTGKPSFITDLINIDEDDNTIAFWHCGNAAPSLYNQDYEVQLRNHPLAGQGTAFYGALKPGPVTIARFCNIDGVYKLFLLRGEALPQDRYTKGTMANVKVAQPVREIIETIAKEGIPHHYSIVWKDIGDELKQFCQLLHIPVIEV